MPLYDYRCPQHGLFDQLVSVAERGEYRPCPVCQASSARVIVTAPRVPQLAKAQRTAHERNERSAHEPARVNLQKDGGAQRPNAPLTPSGAIYTPDGKKLFPAARPWMLGH